jgi:hypothetical protein
MENAHDTLSPRDNNEGVDRNVHGQPSDPVAAERIEFLFQGWVFTKADPDPYPSTPHGHWKNQNQKWPKLNPYSGRAFLTKHQEDVGKRLSKVQMKLLWSDEKFKDFCRAHIVWYRESFPFHDFGRSNKLLLKFPKW